MADRILIEKLAVFAHHGVHAEEQTLGQRFYISLEAHLDTQPAGLADSIDLTVSYVDLAKIALHVATARRFHTLEALAETIAADILASASRITAITVRIDKPSAPIAAIVGGIAVEITRVRHA